MLKIRIKPDYNHGAMMYVLKTRRDQYTKRKGYQPICLYCSSDVGGLYPYAVCEFAIKNGLRIVFFPKDDGDPWIAFGGMTEDFEEKEDYTSIAKLRLSSAYGKCVSQEES